jgi:hypothetical protein
MLQVVEQFLNDKIISASNTRKNYRLSINKYFRDLAGGFSPDWHKLNSEQKASEEQRLEKFIKQYFKNNGKDANKYEKDLRATYMRMEGEGRSLIAIRTYLVCVKQFLNSFPLLRHLMGN